MLNQTFENMAEASKKKASNAPKKAFLESLIFEKTSSGRRALQFPSPPPVLSKYSIPKKLLRNAPAKLPEVSELEVVRHYTRLSQLNYSVDTHFYPLGSCTMKYNPKINDALSALPGFSEIHPWTPSEDIQGLLEILYDLEKMLCEILGMQAFTLQPAAGAQGELVGILIAQAYHNREPRANSQKPIRNKVLIPDSAHGTNPASAALGGLEVVTIKSDARGRVDIEDLKKHLDETVSLAMITVPNTLGLFEDNILEISEEVHGVGALMYLDGANLNALVGLVKPGDFGFDIVHVNIHKTFSIPHGGGGPGGGPVGVKKHLEPFLPIPRIVRIKPKTQNPKPKKKAYRLPLTAYRYRLSEAFPHSIGRVRAFFGNTGALLRAYVYIRLLGAEGLRQVSETAILNANYLRAKLKPYLKPYIDEPCMHECVFTLNPADWNGVRTMDIAKRLLDMGFYAPTVYFPLIVPEAMMVEPTETEPRRVLDEFVEAIRCILEEAQTAVDRVKRAPHATSVRRLDEVNAARFPNLRWQPK